MMFVATILAVIFIIILGALISYIWIGIEYYIKKRGRKPMKMELEKDYYVDESGEVFSEDEIDVVWSEDFEAFILRDDDREYFLDDDMSDIETFHLIK